MQKNAPEHGTLQQLHSSQRELSFSKASLSLYQFAVKVQQSHIPQPQWMCRTVLYPAVKIAYRLYIKILMS